MKPKKNLCLKVMSLVMACVILMQVESVGATVTSGFKTWSLYHNSAGASGENVTKWTANVVSNDTKLTSYVAKYTNSSRVRTYVYLNNQNKPILDTTFDNNGGTTSVGISKNKSLELHADFVSYAEGISSIHGTFNF